MALEYRTIPGVLVRSTEQLKRAEVGSGGCACCCWYMQMHTYHPYGGLYRTRVGERECWERWLFTCILCVCIELYCKQEIIFLCLAIFRVV